MAIGQYVGVNNVARRVRNQNIGVDNVSRVVKSGYIGIDNVARKFYSSDYYSTFHRLTENTDNVTLLSDTFAGIENGMWKFYTHATCVDYHPTDRAYAYAVIKGGDMAGKTLSITYSITSTNYQASGSYDFYDSNNQQISYTTLYTQHSNFITETVTIPENATYMRIGIYQTTPETDSNTFYISSLTIDGEELVQI